MKKTIWMILPIALIFAGSCRELETPLSAKRYKIKFSRVPCFNSFCIRNDPEVEARHRSIDALQRKMKNESPQRNHSGLWPNRRKQNHSKSALETKHAPSHESPHEAISPHKDNPPEKAATRAKAERKKTPKAIPPKALPIELNKKNANPHHVGGGNDDDDDEGAQPKTGEGIKFGGLFNLPRLKYSPSNRMVIDPFPNHKPPTKTVEVEVTQGELTISEAKTDRDIGRVDIKRISASRTALSLTPHAGQTGSLMDWISFKSNINPMTVRLPVRGWSGDEVVFSPGWWDMPSQRAGVERHFMRVTVTFKTEKAPKLKGYLVKPLKMARVIQIADSRPKTATFEIEMDESRFPEGLVEVEVKFVFEDLANEVVWRAMTYNPPKEGHQSKVQEEIVP